MEERIKNFQGKFKIVGSDPKVGELTESELEGLCDPEPDMTGLCLGIVEKIRENNDLDKGTLMEEMLAGGTSTNLEESMMFRARIENAINKMIFYGFLKVNPDHKGIVTNIE